VQKSLLFFITWVFALSLLDSPFSWAVIQFEAHDYSTNLSSGDVTAKGSVRIWDKDQTLFADQVVFNQRTGDIRAYGNVLLQAADQTLFGQEAHYNFNTGLGKVKRGGVELKGKIQLTGDEIEKVSADRFLVNEGTYTACLNCPRTWKFSGSHMDITIEGYAFITDAIFITGDTPLMYTPYLALPIKTKRQSGIVDPKHNYSQASGFEIGANYFWAMDRSYDSTFGYDWFSSRGHQVLGQGRWMTSFIEGGQVDAWTLTDKTGAWGSDTPPLRGAFQARVLERFGDWRFHFSSTFISDKNYIYHFPYIENAKGLTALRTQFTTDTSVWLGLLTGTVTYYEDVQPRSAQDALTSLDHPPMKLPSVSYDVPSVPLYWDGGWGFRGLNFSANSNITNFSQLGGNRFMNVGGASDNPGFDADDIILEGQRVIIEPRLSVPITLGEYVFASGELASRSSAYFFSKDIPETTAHREDVEVNSRVGFSIDRIFELDDDSWKTMKHSIDTFARYRYTPYVASSRHPIFEQKQYGRKFEGFDDFDLLDRVHTLGYEFQQRLGLKRLVSQDLQYSNLVTWITSQDYNFEDTSGKPFGPVNNRVTVTLDQWQGDASVSTDVYNGNSDVTLTLRYTWGAISYAALGHHNRPDASTGELLVDWNYGMGVELPWGLFAETFHSYSQNRNHLTEERYRLAYKPLSQCWHAGVKAERKPLEDTGWAIGFSFGFILDS
jgi:LPS-assembly protein